MPCFPDSREKSLEALRKLIDELASGRFPGLYVLITGTPQFFDGPQGVRRTPALAQRLHTEFGKDPRLDNTRAVQIRLRPFDLERLIEVGRKVRDLYPAQADVRLLQRVDDPIIEQLAQGVTGKLGGPVGIAPRIFLKRLVDLLDRVRALYAVFENPRLLTVRADTIDIGQIEAQFLQALENPEGRPPLLHPRRPPLARHPHRLRTGPVPGPPRVMHNSRVRKRRSVHLRRMCRCLRHR